jgi:hypothetical protein
MITLALLLMQATTPPPAGTRAVTAAPGPRERAVLSVAAQIRRCAAGQKSPGIGAERIRVLVRTQLNPDGSLAAAPVAVGSRGVDDTNREHLPAMEALAIDTVAACAPFTGLPPKLHGGENGWGNIVLGYRIPD